MEEKNLNQLKEIVESYLKTGRDPKEAVQALHDRLSRVEEMLFKASRRVSEQQALSARVEGIFEDAKKSKD
jgi:hypothetical protein